VLYNWINSSYWWTTIDSNSCVFLGAGAVNTNQITSSDPIGIVCRTIWRCGYEKGK